MGAGKLHENLSFQSRAVLPDDGLGNTLGDWEPQFTARAGRKFLRGGEEVLASRLEGVQPVIFTVRKSSNTDAVTTDWRIVDARSGTTYNVQSIEEGETRQTYDILAESGVNDG